MMPETNPIKAAESVPSQEVKSESPRHTNGTTFPPREDEYLVDGCLQATEITIEILDNKLKVTDNADEISIDLEKFALWALHEALEFHKEHDGIYHVSVTSFIEFLEL
jgi:hypothetical protein